MRNLLRASDFAAFHVFFGSHGFVGRPFACCLFFSFLAVRPFLERAFGFAMRLPVSGLRHFSLRRASALF